MVKNYQKVIVVIVGLLIAVAMPVGAVVHVRSSLRKLQEQSHLNLLLSSIGATMAELSSALAKGNKLEKAADVWSNYAAKMESQNIENLPEDIRTPFQNYARACKELSDSLKVHLSDETTPEDHPTELAKKVQAGNRAATEFIAVASK